MVREHNNTEHDMDATPRQQFDAVIIDLDAAVGPRVWYADGVDAEEVDAVIPDGWEVDYSNQVDADSGGFYAPLVQALA